MYFKDIGYSSFCASLLLHKFVEFREIVRKIYKKLFNNILKMLLSQQQQQKQKTNKTKKSKNAKHEFALYHKNIPQNRKYSYND